jgi:pyruvate formate-lyase activating enzyme-like uncharacterized protein
MMGWNRPSPEDQHLLFQIEQIVERSHLASIRERQSKIPGLKQDPLGYVAFLGGDLLPVTCNACLGNSIEYIRNSDSCNLNCNFCYHHGETILPYPDGLIEMGEHFFEPRDVELAFQLRDPKAMKVARWVSQEPLMKLHNMLPLMEKLAMRGQYQTLNTNGVLATESVLKSLADAGLNEIRFNLAATMCNSKVIEAMGNARDLFETVGVESPVFTPFYEAFIKNSDAIIEMAPDHIILAELQLTPKTLDKWQDEGPVYRHHGAYVSPLASRHLTYDIFDLAVQEEWHLRDIVFHDCSNEVKYFRGVTHSKEFTKPLYESRFRYLPSNWYEWAVNEYWRDNDEQLQREGSEMQSDRNSDHGV